MYRIVVVCVFAFLFLNSIALAATEYGSVEKSSVSIDYSKVDKAATLEKADSFFDWALKSKDEEVKKDCLKRAQLEYSIMTQAKQDDIHSVIRLARIYDMLKEDRYAKSYFSRAININYKDVDANRYFGDFYFSRKDYRKALKYYRKAYEYGQVEDFDTLYKMADIYEKFGDIKRAGICYKKAFLINPANEDIADKIRDIEEINVNQAGYYDRRKKD